MDPQLIKTLAEIKAQVPVNMTSDFNVVKPFLRTAELAYVKRIIGADQFDALVALYPADGDPNQAEAILLCQKIIANMGYVYGLPVLSVNIGSSGITVTSNDQTKQAFEWQVSDLKDALIELAFRGIEELLELLESNPDDFADYAASPELAAQEDLLISSAADFTKLYEIGASRLIYQSTAYIMRRIQDQNLVKIYGLDFVQALKSPDLAEPLLDLLNTYIKRGLALHTVAKALIERVITLENGRVAFNFKGRAGNMNQSQPASSQQIADMSDQLITDGDIFLQDGLQHILDNPDLFPGFTVPTPRRRFKVTNKKFRGLAGY